MRYNYSIDVQVVNTEKSLQINNSALIIGLMLQQNLCASQLYPGLNQKVEAYKRIIG